MAEFTSAQGPRPATFTSETTEPVRPIPQAVISVGTVTVDGFDSQFIGSVDQASIFTDFQILNRYQQSKNIYAMPIASPTGFNGGSCAFVQLAAPTLLWIADWTAARTNRKPVIPPPEFLADPNWVLLDVMPETAMVNLTADGATPLYRISGCYVYGHRNPSNDVFVHVRYGRPPWMRDSFQRYMLPDDFQQGLLDDSLVLGTGDGSVGAGGGGSFTFGGTTTTGTGGGSVGAGGGGSFG